MCSMSTGDNLGMASVQVPLIGNERPLLASGGQENVDSTFLDREKSLHGVSVPDL